MRKCGFAVLVSAGLAVFSGASHAAVIYAIDDSSGQSLIRFESASPGSLALGVAISGLQANETIKGIDFRPSTQQLFALGSSNRLYTLHVVTGVATPISVTPFTPVLSGSNFGFDFNPVIDRIRVVSNTKANYVLNPNDGTATVATNLFYGGADPNSGANPNVEFSAYSNNVTPAPQTTQLYGIDSGLDILVTQANSAGTLGTVGPLGVNVGALGGFDILNANEAYAAMLPTSTSASNLYSINLANGAAVNLGQIDGGAVISSMAVAPDGFNVNAPEPGSLAVIGLAALGTLARRRRV
jgi:hypothetical protein